MDEIDITEFMPESRIKSAVLLSVSLLSFCSSAASARVRGVTARDVTTPREVAGKSAGNDQPQADSQPLQVRHLVENSTGAWRIRREWSRSEVSRYARWFENLYEFKTRGSSAQKKYSLSEMLGDSEVNLLLQEGFADDNNDPQLVGSKALARMDSANACGTFPILTYIYYAAVRALPTSLTRIEGTGPDLRYSKGNHPVERFDPVAYASLSSYIDAVFLGDTYYTTGNWRTDPDLEGTDTVPVLVGRESTIPGLTVLYNPDGHGLVVARVTEMGDVRMLDAHPDGSITAGQSLASVEAVIRGVPREARERWYAGWRMIRLAACVTDDQGRVVGTQPYTDEQMMSFGYSDEAFTDILAIREGEPVIIDGVPRPVESFPEYVRLKLQTSELRNPVTMIEQWAEQLQMFYAERAQFVAEAWANVQADGTITLPDDANIYHADGRWEQWSSPSSDCDRKGAYFLVAEQLERLVRDFVPGKSRLNLSGFSAPITSKRMLAGAILEAKNLAFRSLGVSYKSSRGSAVTLSLEQIEGRMFDMSFDPNHPPEIRWGASFDSPESRGAVLESTPLASGGSLSAKKAYEQEKRLRFRLCRKDGRTRFDDVDNPTRIPKPLLEESLAPYLGRSSAGAGEAFR